MAGSTDKLVLTEFGQHITYIPTYNNKDKNYTSVTIEPWDYNTPLDGPLLQQSLDALLENDKALADAIAFPVVYEPSGESSLDEYTKSGSESITLSNLNLEKMTVNGNEFVVLTTTNTDDDGNESKVLLGALVPLDKYVSNDADDDVSLSYNSNDGLRFTNTVSTLTVANGTLTVDNGSINVDNGSINVDGGVYPSDDVDYVEALNNAIKVNTSSTNSLGLGDWIVNIIEEKVLSGSLITE